LYEDIGWWNKIQLFRPDLNFGETIYFDLDTIILKNIDELIISLRKTDGSLLMWETPKNTPSSAIMYWRNDLSKVWLDYEHQRQIIQEKYKFLPLIGDQGYIYEHENANLFNKLLDPNFFAVSNYNSLNANDKSSILIFLGKNSKPNKAKFSNNEIIKNFWK
jgi:hypothetical protein